MDFFQRQPRRDRSPPAEQTAEACAHHPGAASKVSHASICGLELFPRAKPRPGAGRHHRRCVAGNPLYPDPRDPVLRVLRGIAQSGTEGDTVRRLPLRVSSRWRRGDVAGFVAEAALALPINDTVEVAGPDIVHMDEIVARVLEFDKDPRRVIADPTAQYFGLTLNRRLADARPGCTSGHHRFRLVARHMSRRRQAVIGRGGTRRRPAHPPRNPSETIHDPRMNIFQATPKAPRRCSPSRPPSRRAASSTACSSWCSCAPRR